MNGGPPCPACVAASSAYGLQAMKVSEELTVAVVRRRFVEGVTVLAER